MGVPSFYRWLVNKYPNIRVSAIEEKGEKIVTSNPNPNGMEFDNLFLDMNGIIHPCFHPDDHDDQSLPTTYEDVFESIYVYIDNLFSIVRPRKLLFMAIDGVAPRAKMNQQRSRRFRTAKDDEIAAAEEDRLRIQFEMEGKPVLPKAECEVSDSNVITPGTEFMHKLSEKLKGYIQSRLNSDPGWKDIQVILSDANVPGEGEHKIMSFIRNQRTIPGYNCNTRHCLYGLDADLIMLALATHEVHFSILREDVLVLDQLPVFQSAPKPTCNQLAESYTPKRYEPITRRPYEFVHVWILREYLELDMKVTDLPENCRFDLERIIDDFIFMCFFAGNDFLPHMPTLEIHEGAIDLLMTVYKENFKSIGGYLVDMQRVQDMKGGYVKLKRVEKFILQVSTFEEKIFKKRSDLLERNLKRLCQYSDTQQDEENHETENSDLPRTVCENSSVDESALSRNTKDLKQKLKENLRKKSDLFKNGDLGPDKVRLSFPGWKERYYQHKFSAESKHEIETKRKEIVQKYTEGLLWVLLYYYSGVPSWSWFYPYHYGPFASDLKGISQLKINFQKGHPFKPFDQLMSVLPHKSAHALPTPYAKLLTDMDSTINDFYPTELEIDMDGKRFAWQGICKLPFIDDERLLVETKKIEKELTPEESERNAVKVDQLFVSSNLGTKILTLFPNVSPDEKVLMDANVSGVGGIVRMGNYVNLTSPPNILSLLFELPDGNLHVPRPLEGVDYPIKTITEFDIQQTHLWHEYHGSRPPYNRPQSSSSKSSSSSIAEYQHNHNSRKLSSEHEMHKVAGTGWGVGRGSSAHNSNIAGGIADMRISESSHNFGSYGRGQSLNQAWQPNSANVPRQGEGWRGQSSNHSWQPNSANVPRQGQGWRGQSSNHSWQPNSANVPRQGQEWSGQSSNHAWHPNSANVPRQGQGWRGQSLNHAWQPNSANASRQGQGWRGQSLNHAWHPNSANASRQGQGWRGQSLNHAWQPNSANASRQGQEWSGQSLNHAWQPNSANASRQGQGWRAHSPANTNSSSQSLGRGHSVWDSMNGSNSVWLLNSGNASGQGQGRGQFRPSTSASKWHSTDS